MRHTLNFLFLTAFIGFCYYVYNTSTLYRGTFVVPYAPTKKKVPEPEEDFFILPPSLPSYRVKAKKRTVLEQVDRFVSGGSSYPNAKAFNQAAKLEDGFVREVRNVIDPRNITGQLNLGMVCDIHEYLHTNRKYINDPLGQEYFSTPSEYWHDHIGDCDDESICLAVSLGSIGIFSRIVLVHSPVVGHAYVELYLGTEQERLKEYVDYIHARYPDADQKDISFYTDHRGVIWLNLEISNSFPGESEFEGERYHLFYPMYEHWHDLK